jgi:hypothetical protein
MPNNHIMSFQWQGLQYFAIGKTLKYEGGKTIVEDGKICDKLQFPCLGLAWPRFEKEEMCLELAGGAHGGIHLEAGGKAGTQGSKGSCLEGDRCRW